MSRNIFEQHQIQSNSFVKQDKRLKYMILWSVEIDALQYLKNHTNLPLKCNHFKQQIKNNIFEMLDMKKMIKNENVINRYQRWILSLFLINLV